MLQVSNEKKQIRLITTIIMKKILVSQALVLLGFGSFSQMIPNKGLEERMEITGTIEQTADWIYLKQFNGKQRVITDSSKIENGKFNFKVRLLEPQMIYLYYSEKENTPIFAENTMISVQIKEGEKSIVQGSKSNDDWLLIDEEFKMFDNRLDSIYTVYKEVESKSDTSGLAQIEKNYDREDENKLNYISNYIKENPNSYQSAYLLSRFYSFSSNQQELEDLVNVFNKSGLKSVYIETIKRRIEELNKTKVGSIIADFELPDSNGVVINIKDYRGQYVLIDFWASWCGPCRRENPNLVKAYNEFKDDNFTILGVSLDTERDKWLSAIENDHLAWPHISDLKGWNNEVASYFGVKSIPFSMVIDPNGVIIGKDLRGDELIEFLKNNLKP